MYNGARGPVNSTVIRMNKITAQDVMKSLRKTSKGFSLIIDKLIEEYGEDEIDWDTNIEEYAGIYTVFSSLARYVEKLLENNQKEEIQNIFNLVEKWHINGDEYIQEAATIGFIEEIISLNPKHSMEDENFLPFMGSESKKWASQVKEFWNSGKIISDDRNV